MNPIILREVLETLMLVCFGMAWPISISKSLKSKTTKGKSLIFLLIILLGYLCGILKKVVCGEIGMALTFYIINLVMVCIDIGLWIRNYLVYDKNTLLNN